MKYKSILGIAALGVSLSVLGANTLEERYPLAEGVFEEIRKSPLIERALLDPEYLPRLEEPAVERALRSRLADARFRRFGDGRSVRVELLQGTLLDHPAIVLEYQTDWKEFTSLPSGGPQQKDPVMLGNGRDSAWNRTFYGGTDDPDALAAFEALLQERREAPSNKRHLMDERFVKLAEKYLPTTPLSEVRQNVVETIEALVEAFKPYGAQTLAAPELGNYGAKITEGLYLYIRDFPRSAPTRFEHDPFFWLIVSGGPRQVPADFIPAFPGAEGFGALATGGRGGQVIYVTNTNPDGPGSLKEALETQGARTVLFAVSGQIDLPDDTWITQGDLTLIGYTAPGEGVEINGRLCMAASNIIMRGMRFRLRPPMVKDGMSTRGRLENIIFDHCSFAYASDELLRMIGGESSFYGFSIQYCLLGPGLAGLGDHPYGPEVGGYGTFHHNLFYNTLSRSPEIDCVLVDWRHNVMANMRSGHSLRPHSRFNMVGNYIIDIPGNPNRYSFNSNDTAFLAENWVEHGDEVEPFASDYRSAFLESGHTVMPVTKTDPLELVALLTPIAGAYLPNRDSTDLHFIERFKSRESKLPHLKGGKWKPYGNENDNMELYEMWEDANFPPPAEGATLADKDVDGDGMPDSWEEAHGLRPNYRRDGAQDADLDGYTNLEEFLNGTDPNEFVDYTVPANNLHTLH
ncbi:hypothetical protein IEN85_06460 [Pelagicoccus sp. NFK12]|uniref:Pectate lyase n=1 Tax=Pelagicoccus enzymogenes TaxID=2773457 RepID=A0A927IGT0_9BACT|nr:hypothetical protein [Pelagicoccus enzymogenes]MBD5779129.1 hypothetical protein [Pelagicoccus enzymogenes]